MEEAYHEVLFLYGAAKFDVLKLPKSTLAKLKVQNQEQLLLKKNIENMVEYVLMQISKNNSYQETKLTNYLKSFADLFNPQAREASKCDLSSEIVENLSEISLVLLELNKTSSEPSQSWLSEPESLSQLKEFFDQPTAESLSAFKDRAAFF